MDSAEVIALLERLLDTVEWYREHAEDPSGELERDTEAMIKKLKEKS